MPHDKLRRAHICCGVTQYARRPFQAAFYGLNGSLSKAVARWVAWGGCNVIDPIVGHKGTKFTTCEWLTVTTFRGRPCVAKTMRSCSIV